MAYAVDSTFTEKLYSGECNYRAILTIGEQSIDNDQIASISISSPIVDSSTQTFYIGTFISQKITIHFKNMDNLNIYSGEQVDLSIGQYVNNAWVDVPIGKFLIDDLAEDYYEKCEITCLDYAVKFKPNIDYSPCFVDDKATIKTILEYICEQFDVELGDYPTINDDIEIGTYDSTVSGKQWISYIAELKGCNAKMDRNGRLTLQPLKQASNVSINALESASFDLGEKYNITKVTFFDALRNFTYGDDEGNTLFIRQDNPFVTSEEDIRNVYNSICTEKLSAEGKYIDIEDADANDIDLVEIDGETSQETLQGYQMLKKDAFATPRTDTNYWASNAYSSPMTNGWCSVSVPNTVTNTFINLITNTSSIDYEPNTQYTIIFEWRSKNSNIASCNLSQASSTANPFGNNVSFTLSSNQGKVKYLVTTRQTLPSGYVGLRCFFNTTASTVRNIQCRAMIVKGDYTNTDIPYESYCGNIKSPNPDYPQKVNNVSGDNKLVIHNSNLYNSNYRRTDGTIFKSDSVSSATEENGVFTIVASGSDAYIWQIGTVNAYYNPQTMGQLYSIDSGEVYTVKVSNNLLTKNYITWYDKDKMVLRYDNKGASQFTVSFQNAPVGTKYFSLRFGYQSSVSGATYEFTVMMVKGSTISDYVPYTTSEYKIDLPSANEFNKDTTPIFNGYISNGGTITSNANNRILYIPIRENTTYTIEKILGNTPRFRMSLTDVIPANNVSGYNYDANDNVTSMTITNTTHKYLCVWYWTSASSTPESDIKDSIVIYKGTTQPETIELNKIGTYKDKIFKTSGKNLLNTDNIIPNMINSVASSVRSNWVYNSNDKSVTLTVYNTDCYMPSIFYNANYIEGINISVEKNKDYTLSLDVDQPLSTMKNCVMGLNKTTNKYEYITNLTNVTTIVFNSGDYDTITFRIGTNANVSVGTVVHFRKFMLEEGSTATEYEPYGKDEWYLHKEIGKYTFTGASNENWYLSGNYCIKCNGLNTTLNYPLMNTTYDYARATTLGIYSNYGISEKAKRIDENNTTSLIGLGSVDTGGGATDAIYVSRNGQSIADFKAKLANNPLICNYVLNTPKYLKITYQPLIDQLNAIDEEASLFEGTNHITIEPNDEIPTLKINYYKNSNFELYSLKTHNYGDFTLDAWDNINYQLGDKNYLTLNNNDIKYEQNIMGDVNTKIPTKQQEVTTNIIGGDDKTNIKKIKTNVDVLNAEATILSQQQTTTANNLSELTVNVNGISSSVSTIQNATIPNINSNINTINNDIDGINTTINNQNTTINNITSRLSSVEQTADAITNMFQISGGINIIRNSAFLLRDVLWEFTNSGTNPYYTPLGTSYNGTLSGITTSVAEIKLRSIKVKSKSENITNLKIGTKYTFNFYHKQDANVTTTIKMYSTEDNTSKAFNDIVITGQQSLKNYEVSFTPSTYANYTLEIVVENTDNLGYSYMYDMMLNTGDKQSWQPASDEIYSTTLTMSRLGLQVYSVGDGTITLLGTEGLLTYETTDGKTLGNLVSKRTLDGDLVRSTTTQALYVTPNIASVIEDPTTPKWVNTTATISSKLTYIEYLESGD